jgi:hypothetical protein
MYFVAGCQRGAAFISSRAGQGRSCDGLESVAPLARATIFQASASADAEHRQGKTRCRRFTRGGCRITRYDSASRLRRHPFTQGLARRTMFASRCTVNRRLLLANNLTTTTRDEIKTRDGSTFYMTADSRQDAYPLARSHVHALCVATSAFPS